MLFLVNFYRRYFLRLSLACLRLSLHTRSQRPRFPSKKPLRLPRRVRPTLKSRAAPWNRLRRWPLQLASCLTLCSNSGSTMSR